MAAKSYPSLEVIETQEAGKISASAFNGWSERKADSSQPRSLGAGGDGKSHEGCLGHSFHGVSTCLFSVSDV